MPKTLSKILRIVLLVLLAISVLLGVLFYIKIAPLKPDEIITPDLMKYIDWFMAWGVILTVLVVFFTFVVGPIMAIISNPKGVVKSLISIVILAVIVGIGFAFSSPSTEGINLAAGLDSITNIAPKLKIADTSFYTIYILAGLGVLAIFFAEIKGLLKL